MVTGAVSAAPVLDYTGAERQGGTRQEKETRKERLGIPRVGNMGSSLNEKEETKSVLGLLFILEVMKN